MIEQKLLAIQKSIESYSVHLDMLMKLDRPIADFRVSSRIQSTDLFYKENSNTITINRALEKLKESYVELENPIHAAGAYKFESLGCNLFSSVNGSSYTIRGMPLSPLLSKLREMGVINLEQSVN